MTPNINTNTSTNTTTILPSLHDDYIFATALDVYGRRLATASGDRWVRIWDLDDDGRWNPVAAWPAHRGPVTGLAWAHPEFGNLLATVGTDQETKIWEELQSTSTSTSSSSSNPPTSNTNLNSNNSASSSSSRWILKASLTEARRAVTCCEFAPRHWGLKLAAGSADGSVRLYEAVDVMNLAQWPLAATLECGSSISTNTTTSTTAAAANTTTNNNTTANTVSGGTAESETNTTAGTGGSVTAISWCTGRFDPPTLAVATGSSGVRVMGYSEALRAWQVMGHWPGSYTDVAWAPNVGRRYHTLALVASSVSSSNNNSKNDGTVTVCRWKRQQHANNSNSNSTENTTDTAATNTTKNAAFKILSQQEITNSGGGCWQCQWNVTGTVLATAGDGGRVRLYKADNKGMFHCVAHIPAAGE